MQEKIDVLIIQPPLVQLNTPYPSGAYLQAFFKDLATIKPEFNIGNIRWIDTSNLLYQSIFSREGLQHIFSVTEEKALMLAEKAEKTGNENEAFNLQRYIICQKDWCRWIPSITSILTGKSRELCQEFIHSPSVPRGQRMENYLASLDRDVEIDDSNILASLALADIADYISVVFDKRFALVRYAESLATSTKGFSAIEKALEAPILKDFYEPILNDIVKSINPERKTLICLSCPFPGTLAAALFAGKYFKTNLKNKVFVVMGGGYVNTELRKTQEKKLSDYIDALSYDRGYASYWDFFSQQNLLNFQEMQSYKKNYGMRFFTNECVIENLSKDELSSTRLECIQQEDSFTRNVVPDFSGIDFSKYPRLADSKNPMHRLWSDGSWLKAYIAHGCYWHKCAFCDTTLDYVCSYKKTNIEKLHESLYQQAQKMDVKGVHLVDEAAPPVSLQEFALLNLKKENPLSFWGNIRYEKTFSRDLADLLAHSGMTGVSGGIEIASGKGLDAICKGTDLDTIVAACAAFKEAGILTHAYMIYGYWLETPQLLIDSMETLRQLFASGLIDSAFWHKFTLTRHSRIFDEYKKGLHPELKPLDAKGNYLSQKTDVDDFSVFASNDIRFEGEEKSCRYSSGLDEALANWMAGENLDKPVEKWFNFTLPKPSVSPNLVENAIKKYEEIRNKSFQDFDVFLQKKGKGYIWLGGKPILLKQENFILCWKYMGEIFSVDLPSKIKEEQAKKIVSTLLSFSVENVINKDFIPEINLITKQFYNSIRGNGLCKLIL